MSECKLDHSLMDVRKKLEEQADFLPSELYTRIDAFLGQHTEQQTLNEIFHLLKKYDLVSAEERQTRNKGLESIIS